MHTGTPYPLLKLDDPEGTERTLRALGWLDPGEEVVRIARAGEGNMNLVLRVATDRRSMIVKQSRPWVEKYPSIEAPADRMLVEMAFYDAVRDHEGLAAGLPRLLAADRGLRLAAFEDLGDVVDFTSMYADGAEGNGALAWLAGWLSALHGAPFPDPLRRDLANRAMRRLNHAHLFDIPLRPDNGLDLDAITPGLQAPADRLKSDRAYRDAVVELGRLYLEDGPVLLHGDFYPGSWVRGADGPRVIDPEFCFFGPAEYDVGVLVAHLFFARVADDAIRDVLSAYTPPAGFDGELAGRFAGMEVMRRLIGVAQLPMVRTLDEKEALLGRSRSLVLGLEAAPGL